jgi:hypothetical protein
MNKIKLLTIFCFLSAVSFAQTKQASAVKPAAVVTPATTDKPVVIVPTKELKKQLERNFKRKKYKAVLPIADTLLSRNRKDENVFMKKVSSEIFLKMDKKAIADLKTWYKNKDTAATIISLMPYQFDFKSKNRSGDVYYKSAMAMAPKNGIPFIMYAGEMADAKKPEESVFYAKKGYEMLTPAYKKYFTNTYASVLHNADKKEEAYKILDDAIAAGGVSEDLLRDYFGFYMSDKRYQDGIDRVTELIRKDSLETYFSSRAMLFNAMDNKEKACEDATTLRDYFGGGTFDFWMKRFSCPAVMADVQPIQQRTYIYEVIFQGKTYDFRVTNPKVDMASGVSFKYKMTGDVGINGIVRMTKAATDTAHVQMNMFGGSDYDLEDQTSVWLSNAVFNELKTKGESFIQASTYSAQVFEVVNDESTQEDDFYTVKVDDQDKYIKCIKIASKDGADGQEIWINDDPKNPLILKMKLDFSIELKQIL